MAMRYNQPQSGPYKPALDGELLSSGKLLALIIGSSHSHNLADGKLLTKNGSVVRQVSRGGVSAFNAAGSGDLSCTIEAVGGSVFVDFWYGVISANSGDLNQYIFGDYNGSVGYGITARHGSSGGNWGLFSNPGVETSGEGFGTIMDGVPHSIVVVREVAGSTVKVYRDGVLKITSSGIPALQTNFAVGSLGANQHGSFGTESSTLLAGRIRYKSWTATQVRKFAANPWMIFEDNSTSFLQASAGDGSANGTLTATLGAVTIGATGATPIAAAAAQTLGSVTLAAAGGAVVSGGLTRTLGDVTLAATGGSGALTGTLAATLGAIGLSAAGTAPIAGAAAMQLGAFALTGAGQAPLAGQLARTLGDVALAAAGTVVEEGTANGTLTATLGAVGLAGSGAAPIAGASANTLGPVALAGAGAAPIAGTLSRPLGTVGLAGEGSVLSPRTGTLAGTLGPVTLAATGTNLAPITGTANITLGPVTLVAYDRAPVPTYYQGGGGDDVEDHREFYARLKKERAKREATTVEVKEPAQLLEKVEQLPVVEPEQPVIRNLRTTETAPAGTTAGLAQPTAAKPPIVNDYDKAIELIMQLLPEMFEEEELE